MPMNQEHIHNLKTKLETELSLLEKELQTVGRVNPENKDDWQPTPAVMDALSADENEVADTIEEFEDNTAILKQLETRLHEVKKALEKIENNAFGKCEVCGAEIETDRLEVNPAAATCTLHM